jgi:hypothetical protein
MGEVNLRVDREVEECPVCLEPLVGTVVRMGCCRNKVHIQCYIDKCPLCRTQLPLPHQVEPNQIIVPVPVPVQPPARRQYHVPQTLVFLLATGLVIVITVKQH